MTTRRQTLSFLFVAAALLVVGRVALAFLRTGPVVVADEVGYLTNARIFAGGLPGQMADAPFYRGGYSLVVSPVVALLHDAETTYRGVLMVNALLAATMLPLLFVLLTRCFGIGSADALWPATAGAAYPSITVFTQAALSENALLPLATLWLICVGSLAASSTTKRRAAWSVASSLTAGALFLVHGRMIVALGVTAALLLVLWIRRRLSIAEVMLGLIVLAGGVVATRLVDDYLVRRNYGVRHTDEAGNRLANLESIHGIAATLRGLVGQSWYVVVATLGLAVVAAAAVSPRPMLRRLLRLDAPATVVSAAVLSMLALLVATALSFPEIDRPDMLVYGRYAEIFTPVVIAVVLSRPRRLGSRRGAVTAIVILAAWTVASAALQARFGPSTAANGWNVAALPFPTLGVRPAAIVGAGIVAGACVAGLGWTARRRPAAVAPIVLLLYLGVAAAAEHETVLVGEHATYPAGWSSPAGAATRGPIVAYDLDHPTGLYVNQWFLTDRRVVLFRGNRPPAVTVISATAWGRDHPSLHPVVLWRDPAHGQAMFFVRR